MAVVMGLLGACAAKKVNKLRLPEVHAMMLTSVVSASLGIADVRSHSQYCRGYIFLMHLYTRNTFFTEYV